MNDEPNPMASAGRTLELGGRTYMLSRSRKIDIDDFLTWLESELRKLPSPVDAVKPSLEGMPEKLQERLLDMAYVDLKAQWELDGPNSRRIQDSLSGTAYLAWLHLRARHPELTYEEVKGLIDREEVDLEQMQAELDELKGLRSDPPVGPQAMTSRAAQPTGRASIAIFRAATHGRRRKSIRSRSRKSKRI
jgi:hypothetical protein